eukprot:8108316-Alexandrium_andersonii.AAC.1
MGQLVATGRAAVDSARPLRSIDRGLAGRGPRRCPRGRNAMVRETALPYQPDLLGRTPRPRA